MSVPIAKSYEDADGILFVEGIATNDTLDLDDQIIDRDFARKAMSDWFAAFGNIRQMHSTNLPPAGKAMEFEERPEGFWVRSKVVEPGAIKLVKEGVYQAYSIGISRPRIIRDPVAKNGRVVDGIQSELSLVDFPANPTAKFMLAKRAADGGIEIVEKHIGPELTKAGPSDDDGVTIDGHRVTPSDLAAALRKLGKASGAVEPHAVKRDMDPNVGGGVDRDKLPASDFVFGDERVFPVVTPKDVHDAWSSWGRYEGKHSFDEFKKRLTALANRKGPSFAAQLPKEWKDDSTTKTTTEPEVTKTTVEPEVAKGAKDCPKCDKTYHSDTSAKFCENCGTKLPAAAEKAAEADLAKELYAVESGAAHGAEGLEVLRTEAEVAKAADAKPGVAEHREPDGDEDGPDVDGDGDGAKPTAEQAKANKSGAAAAAYHLLRLHDATCAAFGDADVLAAHPALAKGIASVVDPAVFGEMVTKALTEDAGTGSRIDELPGLSEAYGFAVSLKALDAELLEQAMAGLRKSFADEYPDAHPTPTDVEPGKFQRPYISAGRAALSAKAGQKPRVPLASHVPDPADFQRPLITDGHEAAAPASVVKSGRTYYTSAAREQAAGVLTAMHDYIAAQHPAVCPMGDSPAIPAAPGGTLNTATTVPSTLDNRATAVPTPAVAKSAPETTTEQAPAPAAQQALLDTELVKTVLGDLLAEHLNPINETLAKYEERLVDLESSPDPAAGALRGSALTALKRANADETQAGLGDGGAAESLVRLVKRARHPDTSVSVPAIEQLMEQIGDNPAGLTKLLGS